VESSNTGVQGGTVVELVAKIKRKKNKKEFDYKKKWE
jgi:hypothetical protein